MHFVMVQFSKKLHRLFQQLRIASGSSANRSAQRYRRILITTGASFAARGVSVATALITVPLCIGYLGREQYGIWMAISSFFVIMGFTDLGIGNGLLNAVAEASGQDDQAKVRTYVSNAFIFLTAIGSACMLIAFAAYGFIPLHKLFNVSSPDAMGACDQAVLAFALVFSFGLPLMVVQRLLEGRQEGYIVQLFQIMGSILSLLLIYIFIRLHLGLPWLVLGYQGGMAAAVLVNCCYQFWWRIPWARPSVQLFDAVTARRLVKTGMIFFALNILGALGMQTDALVIANVLKPETVTSFAVVQRLSQIAFIYWASFQALWPAYSEAIARNDLDWVRRTISRTTMLSVGCGATMGVGLLFYGQTVISWWIRPQFLVPPALLFGFGAFIFVNSLTATLAVVMCTGILLKQQLILLSITVPICFFLKIIFCRHWGVSGPIWATALSYGVFYVLPGFFILHRALACRANPKEIPVVAS
jgi:O-antigen/teichoic acid export membrane protein